MLGGLFYRAYQRMPSLADRQRAAFFLALVSAGLYGIGDEIHQAFVPFRQADPADAAADIVGALAGVVFWHAAFRRFSGPGKPGHSGGRVPGIQD